MIKKIRNIINLIKNSPWTQSAIDNITIDDFSENAYRVRRNLILFAIISIFYKVSEAQVGNEINILGATFKIQNNDLQLQDLIDLFLLIILLYHLVHFCWLAIEHWRYCVKIRITGDSKNFIAMIPGGQEIPDKKRSNFYKILNRNQIDLDALTSLKEEVIEKVKTQDHQKINKIFDLSNSDSLGYKIDNNLNLIRQFFENKECFDDLKQRLERFDKHWKFYGISQIMRWFIFEYGIPIVIGIYGIHLLFFKFFLHAFASQLFEKIIFITQIISC